MQGINRLENLEKMLFQGVGKYNIPEIAPERDYPMGEFVPINYAKTAVNPTSKIAHCFVDDYQFSRFWNRPNDYIEMLQKFRAVCAPDFSTYIDMPLAMQIYNHYRKHWVAAYWQANGIKVYPTISWSTEDSYNWCFDGEPTHSVVAVSSVGTQGNAESKRLFLQGYEEMMKRLEPEWVIFYGKVPHECDWNIVRVKPHYDAIVERRKRKKALDSAMRGGGIMGGRGGTIRGKNTAANPTAATPQPQAAPTNFENLRGSEADQMLAALNHYNVSTRRAIGQYIRMDQDSAGYTMSQNMNHKLEAGGKLNANEQYTYDYMMNGMQPIGQDVTLTRAAHQDMLQRLGINNYDNMSESQLQQSLVGKTYAERKLVSTSVDPNKNPFITDAPSGGREVMMTIKAPSTTQGIVGNRNQSELVLSPNATYRITDVYYTGDTAYPRSTMRAMPVLHLDVEIIQDGR